MFRKFREWLRHRSRRRLAGFLATIAGIVWTAHPRNGKEVLDSLSRGETVITLTTLLKHVGDFFASPFLGLYLLVPGIVLIWWSRKDPDPTLEKPLTPEQRLGFAEDRLDKLDQSKLVDRMNSVEHLLTHPTSHILGVDSPIEQTVRAVPRHEERLKDAEKEVLLLRGDYTNSMKAVSKESETQRQMIGELAGRLDKSVALKSVPRYVIFISQLTALMLEAARVKEAYELIYRTHHTETVTRKTFSEYWGAQRQAVSDPLWFFELEDALYAHMNRCRAFASVFEVDVFNTDTRPFLDFVNNAHYADLNAFQCMLLLQKHKEHLDHLRDTHAASFIAAPVKDTIS